MKNQAANIPLKRWTLAGPIIAVVAVLIPVAIYLMQPEPEPPVSVTTAVKEKKAPPRFGPGVLIESRPEAASDPTAVDPGAPPGLAVTPDQRLLINREMRDVYDYFLLASTAADRATRVAKLHAHLKAKLPSAAYEEAAQIASNYLAYLNAFESLMASESMFMQKSETRSLPSNADEVERFSTRITQISRLRQSMLGVKIAQIWFAEEEANMQQSLTEMRQLNANPQQPNVR